MRQNIWRSKINAFLSFVCVGTVALGAWFVIWQAAFGDNPLANAIAAQLAAEYQSY